MQCEICGENYSQNQPVCPGCGAPSTHVVPGFPETPEIQKKLRQMIMEQCKDKPTTPFRAVSLIKDYLVSYKKETRLLVYAIQAGALHTLVKETDYRTAIIRTRSYLMSDCYISEQGTEFVLACLTYMLKRPYVAPDEMPSDSSASPSAPESESIAPEEPQKAASSGSAVGRKPFGSINALKFKLAKYVVIPEKYTELEGFCFDNFSRLQAVQLPKDLTSVGEYAFSACKNLKAVELPESVRIIGQGAFNECTELTSVNIPKGVHEIADNVFFCCENLKELSIPPTVSSIGAQAFSGCERLERLIVPESVKYIDERAFLCCPKLKVRCFANSYTHKFCVKHNIPANTVPVGADLYDLTNFI